MKTAERLRAQLAAPGMAEQWLQIINSPVWHAVTEVVMAEAVESVTMFAPAEHDSVMARRIAALKGVREAILGLQNVFTPRPTPPEEPEQWGHVGKESP